MGSSGTLISFTYCRHQLIDKLYPEKVFSPLRGCTLMLTLHSSAGNVLLSMGELNLYPDSPLYAAIQSGERIFMHVIPPPKPQQFKLVSFV